MQLTLALAALTALSGAVFAADKTDFAAELKRIESASRQGAMREGRYDQKKALEAQKQANAEMETLVKKADEADQKTMKPEDLAAVAQASLRLRKPDLAFKWAELAIKADEKSPSAHETKVRTLVALKKAGDAEKALEAAPSLNPRTVESLHLLLAGTFESNKQYEAAIKHLRPFVASLLVQVKSNPLYASSFASYTRRLANLYVEAKKPDDGLNVLQANAVVVRKLAAENPKLAGAATDLQLSLAEFLRDQGREGDAQKVVQEETASVEKALADANGDLRGIHVGRKVKVMEAAAEGSDEATAARIRTDMLAYVGDEATKHRKDVNVVRAAMSSLMTASGSWMYSDAKAAKAALDKAKSLLDALGDDVPERGGLEQQLVTRARGVAGALDREALIGKPLPEPNPDAWINGSPLSPADLKGKVILLDFWAVWCGPCIQTFPHLREWNEKYAKDGLVIVGVTRYYEYGWDDAEKRATKRDEISKEEERKETEKFLAFHQLKHPSAVFNPEIDEKTAAKKQDKYSQALKVTGIPQAVVIDRKGNVRLIRVGSGPANAHAIEAMIKKCLAEPAS